MRVITLMEIIIPISANIFFVMHGAELYFITRTNLFNNIVRFLEGGRFWLRTTAGTASRNSLLKIIMANNKKNELFFITNNKNRFNCWFKSINRHKG